MTNGKLVTGAAALAVGSLLMIGAGCVPATSASDGDDGGRPAAVTREGGGRPDYRPSSAENAPTDAADAREITVTATDFAFSPAEIQVKKGEKIKLTLVNGDGTHGIAIPAFNVNIRPAPGEAASAVFTADQAGSFPFFCNVFCGGGHGRMRGTLTVE